MNQNLAKNLLASIIIFLVALPLNLGIALASGVSPTVGLLSGIIAGIVVGSLAGCPLQVSGPAAGLIAMVWQITNAHGLAMLGPVVLAAGLLQIALGASKLAPWFRAVAPSVIQGMLAGIGVLIFSSQFHVMLAQEQQVSGIDNLKAIPGAIWQVVSQGDGHPSALIGLLTIGTIVGWSFIPKKFQLVPGSLAGVVAAIVGAMVFKPDIQYVVLPKEGAKLTFLSMEQLSGLASPSVWGSILALAFIATAQTLLTATAIDRMHDGERTNYNKEVMAQGAGNAVCGMFGLLPISGVIVRSATNVEAGATGRVSAVMHGIWVALFLFFLGPLLGYVPLAALAAVLVYTGYRLVNIKAIKELKKFGNAELAIYIGTLAGVVCTNLLSGILFGFFLSAAHLIYTITHCEIKTSTHPQSGATIVELSGSATFFTLPKLAGKLGALEPKKEVHLFMSGLNYIDHACLEQLMSWEELYIQQGGEVFIEWDHLIQRFKNPVTQQTAENPANLVRLGRHETYDILASRAKVVFPEKEVPWNELSDFIVEQTADRIPQQQTRLVSTELEEQFREQNFPVVGEVAMPHLMIPGLNRHELVLVRLKEPLQPLDPTSGEVTTVVLLVGPKEYTEHLDILASLSHRAEENLSQDLSLVKSEREARETLLRHKQYVTLSLESDKATQEFIGKAIWQMAKSLPPGCLVASIERDDQSFIPGGNTAMKAGDALLILGSPEATSELFNRYVKGLEPSAVTS